MPCAGQHPLKEQRQPDEDHRGERHRAKVDLRVFGIAEIADHQRVFAGIDEDQPADADQPAKRDDEGMHPRQRHQRAVEET